MSSSRRRLAKQAGLPAIRMHDLRHSHATLLLASGVNPKVASERLGHHPTAFTLDVYSHVIPGMQSDDTCVVLGARPDHPEEETQAPSEGPDESTQEDDDDYPDDTNSRNM